MCGKREPYLVGCVPGYRPPTCISLAFLAAVMERHDRHVAVPGWPNGTISANSMVMLAARCLARPRSGCLLSALLLLGASFSLSTRADQAIYTDSLQNEWTDWGWATINYNNTSPVHSGSKSVAVTIVTNTWQAIYIAHAAFNSSPYSSLIFWINGGTSGGQRLQVVGHAGNAPHSSPPTCRPSPPIPGSSIPFHWQPWGSQPRRRGRNLDSGRHRCRAADILPG